jgi:RNA polymerase subunit RPABC4/transcription elongation factor Spt4
MKTHKAARDIRKVMAKKNADPVGIKIPAKYALRIHI